MKLIQKCSYNLWLAFFSTFILRIQKLLFFKQTSSETTSFKISIFRLMRKISSLWFMDWKDLIKKFIINQKLKQNPKNFSKYHFKVQGQLELREMVNKWQWLMKIHEQCLNTQCQQELKRLLLLVLKIKIGIFSGLIIRMPYLEKGLNKKSKTWKNMHAKLFTQT